MYFNIHIKVVIVVEFHSEVGKIQFLIGFVLHFVTIEEIGNWATFYKKKFFLNR